MKIGTFLLIYSKSIEKKGKLVRAYCCVLLAVFYRMKSLTCPDSFRFLAHLLISPTVIYDSMIFMPWKYIRIIANEVPRMHCKTVYVLNLIWIEFMKYLSSTADYNSVPINCWDTLQSASFIRQFHWAQPSPQLDDVFVCLLPTSVFDSNKMVETLGKSEVFASLSSKYASVNNSCFTL